MSHRYSTVLLIPTIHRGLFLTILILHRFTVKSTGEVQNARIIGILCTISGIFFLFCPALRLLLVRIEVRG